MRKITKQLEGPRFDGAAAQQIPGHELFYEIFESGDKQLVTIVDLFDGEKRGLVVYVTDGDQEWHRESSDDGLPEWSSSLLRYYEGDLRIVDSVTADHYHMIKRSKFG